MHSESFSDLWQARYGENPPEGVPDFSGFMGHRSVRDFEVQPIAPEVLAGLFAAAQSAATSSNLQLFSYITVQDPERRAQVNALCSNQKQITEAPVFLVVCVDLHRHQAMTQPNGLHFTEVFLTGCVDAALATERLVCAAESIGLGSCYIGAMRNHPKELAALLNLPPRVFGIFGLCLGYPKAEAIADIKPRLAQNSLVFSEQYDQNFRPTEYDERMRGYFASRNVDPAITWSMRSGRRLSKGNMSGREELGSILRDLGFNQD